ncbi:MAG: 4Fe-4S dicluster domain-containing protein [Bacteroidetes bacterium]|jgi:ferredoxin|nr:4Fe-4S dicluster domain-containing protein [Bacteroidota bacterium]
MGERNFVKPDPQFIADIKHFGGESLKKCYQCATCTSTCPLSTEENGFPRRQMLLAEWGLKDRLLEDPGPWLCFYCGDCSERCPRNADPGETMMAMRRYLTSQYDWTGLSRLMYGSVFWEVGILAAVAAVVLLLFTLPHDYGFGLLSRSGSTPLSTVMLDKFAPVGIMDWGDRIMAGILGVLLLINAARMFSGLTRSDKVPLTTYISQLPHFIFQGLTQIRWRDCGSRAGIKNWLRHLFLVSGYAIMFTLVVVFLPWFQVENTSLHWTSFLGYYATAVLLASTVWIMIDRSKKRSGMHGFSHFSDWLFPILLFLAALTGILLHVFRVTDMPMATYVTYMIHMAIVVPMLVVEVPFGKWGHLLYRPLAIYVEAVRSKARHSAVSEVTAAGQMVEQV